MFVFQCNFTKGCGSNETNKTLRWFDTHDLQPWDNFPTLIFWSHAPLTHSYCARDEIPRSCVSSLDISIWKVYDCLKSTFIIKVARKVAWSKAKKQRKLLSSSLIIWIFKQLVSLFHVMKGAYLGKEHKSRYFQCQWLCHIHSSTFHNSTTICSSGSLCQNACPNVTIQ
jgi:hypothetical protein